MFEIAHFHQRCTKLNRDNGNLKILPVFLVYFFFPPQRLLLKYLDVVVYEKGQVIVLWELFLPNSYNDANNVKYLTWLLLLFLVLRFAFRLLLVVSVSARR